MYSPTLTVGISNINDTKIHYHYDSGNSMDVLSSLQMTKRTRNAETIKMYLEQRTKYLSTDKYQIQKLLTDYLVEDQDGDQIGISETGEKLSIIYKIFNTLENLHKDSFKRLLSYQFILNSNIKVNSEKVKPFIIKMSKLLKLKEIDKGLQIFDTYLRMEPNEVSEIISKIYTNKNEKYIKMFEFYKDDPFFKELNENILNDFIKEEIKNKGFIENLKILADKQEFNIINRMPVITLKKVLVKKNYPKDRSEFKSFYKKIKNRWYLIDILIPFLKDKNENN